MPLMTSSQRNAADRHVEDRRMKFILINGRTPRVESFCGFCCEPIGETYLREVATRLRTCDHTCYVGHHKLASLKRSKSRDRVVMRSALAIRTACKTTFTVR